ncbi:MAG: hypothetical protein AABX24_05240, partial [Nanoarchaeota archaeon]
QEMQNFAISRNGVCLSKEYTNANSVLLWKCANDHAWKSAPHDIKRGSWCPHCSHRAKLTIEEMHDLSKSRGGKCLSKEYVNNKVRLEWQCEKEHVWRATAHDIKSGHWCSKCATKTNAIKRMLTIEEMREIASSRGGMCLSDKYVNANTKLKWKCKEGHIWETIPSSIKTGKWCLICAGKRKFTFEDMQKLAESRDGVCLSKGMCIAGLSSMVYKYQFTISKNYRHFVDEPKMSYAHTSKGYVNIDTKLEWKCKDGHIWKAIPYTVKSGHWCQKCGNIISGMKQRLTIEEMQKLAKSKEGKFLSKEYANANSPLKWQCNEGHVWKARPANIKRGQWCPNCARGIGERTCRKYIESMFGKNFPSSKPKWLVTKKGTRLELDGYSKELKLPNPKGWGF